MPTGIFYAVREDKLKSCPADVRAFVEKFFEDKIQIFGVDSLVVFDNFVDGQSPWYLVIDGSIGPLLDWLENHPEIAFIYECEQGIPVDIRD